jgi:hypothetical protein
MRTNSEDGLIVYSRMVRAMSLVATIRVMVITIVMVRTGSWG